MNELIDCQIDVEGVEPSYIRHIIQNKLRWIYGVAPSESHLNFTIKQLDNHQFQGSFTITSPFSVFHSEDEGTSPIPVINKIFRTVGGQLEDWKKNRWLEGEHQTKEASS